MCRGRNEETIEQKRRSVQARPPAAVLLSLPLLKLVRGHIASLSGFAPTTSLTFRSSAPPLFLEALLYRQMERGGAFTLVGRSGGGRSLPFG